MLAVIKKLEKLMNKQQKKRIILIFLITIAGAFLEVIGVSLMLPFVSAIMQPDIIETNDMIRKICEILDLHSHRTFAIACIIMLIFIFLFKNIYLIIEYYIQARFVYNNQFNMQQYLLHIFLSRPYEYFLGTESGEVLRAIQNDVPSTYSLLTTLISLFSEGIVSLALSITVFFIDPTMTVFVVFILGVITSIIVKVIKPVLSRKGEERQKYGALNYKWIIQSINGIKEIKVMGKEEFFKKNYEISGKKYTNAEKWNAVFNNIPRLFIEMSVMCSVFAFIAFSIYKGRDINSLIPTLAAFAMAAVKLMPSANRIIAAVNVIAYQGLSLDKLLEDIEWFNRDNVELNNKKGCISERISINNCIELKNIFYKYPNTNRYVLENAGMQIPIGKSIGIVGKSGSGKTTVVDIILGLLNTESGTILVDGKDVADKEKTWLGNLGYIPQSIFLLDDTIKANIAFGISDSEIDENKLMKAIEKSQLGDFIKTLPDGVNSHVGERGVRLSGGQRQRIGIARTLYSDPGILVFDEATAALDNETEKAIMESINGLHGEKTIIIIAHRLQTIKDCDLVYRVENGKIVRER